jgi:hypothetical protein
LDYWTPDRIDSFTQNQAKRFVETSFSIILINQKWFNELLGFFDFLKGHDNHERMRKVRESGRFGEEQFRNENAFSDSPVETIDF